MFESCQLSFHSCESLSIHSRVRSIWHLCRGAILNKHCTLNALDKLFTTHEMMHVKLILLEQSIVQCIGTLRTSSTRALQSHRSTLISLTYFPSPSESFPSISTPSHFPFDYKLFSPISDLFILILPSFLILNTFLMPVIALKGTVTSSFRK